MTVKNKLKPPSRWWLPLVAVLLLYALPAASAQESWEGNAALIRRGEFTSPGLFAASDAFPLNTRIRVTDLRTGRQVDVTVLRRTDGAGAIFLLMSEEAAAQIGLAESEVVPVRVRLAPVPGLPAPEAPDIPAYSEDPDLNPAISVDEAVIAAAGTQPEWTAQPAPVAEQPVPEAATDQPAPLAEQPVFEPPAEESEPLAEELPGTPEEQRLAKLSQRLPQKQLFLPPHRPDQVVQPVIAAEPPVEAVAEAPLEEPPVEAAVEAPTPEPPVEAAVEAPTPEPAVEAVAEAPTPEPAVTGTVAPPVVEQREEVPLELPGPPPLAEAPQAEPPVATPAPVAAPPPAVPQPVVAAAPAAPPARPAATDLPQRSYFVQLGAYSTPGLAEKLAGQLRETYEVVVLAADSKGRRIYRVLVGPLNRDESGTLLYKFRARGFKDAFVRYVE